MLLLGFEPTVRVSQTRVFWLVARI